MRGKLSSDSGSAFKRNFLRIAKASVLARVIALLISPILARIFTPEDFGLAALFAVAVTVILSFAMWKFDQYLPNADTPSEALSLCVLSASALSITLVLTVLAIRFPVLSIVPTREEIGPIVYLLPLAVLVGAAVKMLQSLQVRRNDLTVTGRSFLREALVNAVLLIALGLVAASHVMMIIGRTIGTSVALLTLVRGSTSEIRTLLAARPAPLAAFLTYRSEATWNTGAAFLNSLNQLAPILLFGHFYTAREVGLYSMMYAYAAAPVTVLGMAISSSFWAEAATLYRDRRFAGLKSFYVSTTRRLMGVALLAALGCVAVSPLVDVVLGDEWDGAGLVLVALIPRIVGSLTFGVTNHLVVLKKNHLQFVGDMLSLALAVGAVYLDLWLDLGFVWTVTLMSVASLIGYLLMFFFQIREHRRLIAG